MELNCALNEIINIYISELAQYIKPERLEFVRRKQRENNIIKFDENESGAYCTSNNIVLGKREENTINSLAKTNEYYGTDPKKILVEDKDFVDCEKDYLDYFKWFILTGKTMEDFHLDVLPHEAMHFIGISGGALGEGVTERRTREICKKNNIRCAPVFHSKECKVIGLIEEVLGKEITTRMGFSKGPYRYKELDREIDKRYGKDTFLKIFTEVELPYREVYLGTKYPDMFEKFKAYRKLDFSCVKDLLKNKQIEEEYLM